MQKRPWIISLSKYETHELINIVRNMHAHLTDRHPANLRARDAANGDGLQIGGGAAEILPEYVDRLPAEHCDRGGGGAASMTMKIKEGKRWGGNNAEAV